MTRNRSRLRRLGWFAVWLSATVGVLWFKALPISAPLENDEFYWVGSSYYFDLAFIQTDWTHPDWALLPARENPPVAKYVLGLGLLTNARHVSAPTLLSTFYAFFEDVPGAWGKGSDYAAREQVALRMSPELRAHIRAGNPVGLDPTLLIPARRTALVCAAIASFLLFVLGFRWISPLAGVVSSQLLLFHPTVVAAYNHAMADAVALMFTAATAVAACGFLGIILAEPEPGRSPFWSASLTGVLAALACGSKMNSLVIVFTLGLAVGAVAIAGFRRDRQRGIRIALAGGWMGFLALAVFVLINPTIVRDIPGGLWATIHEHRLTEAVQAGFLPGHLVTLRDKFSAMTPLALFSIPVLLLLTSFAAAMLALRNCALRFIGCWFLVSLVCVTWWIPFAWGRYVLPIVLPATLVAGWAVSELVGVIQRRMGGLAPASAG